MSGKMQRWKTGRGARRARRLLDIMRRVAKSVQRRKADAFYLAGSIWESQKVGRSGLVTETSKPFQKT